MHTNQKPLQCLSALHVWGYKFDLRCSRRGELACLEAIGRRPCSNYLCCPMHVGVSTELKSCTVLDRFLHQLLHAIVLVEGNTRKLTVLTVHSHPFSRISVEGRLRGTSYINLSMGHACRPETLESKLRIAIKDVMTMGKRGIGVADSAEQVQAWRSRGSCTFMHSSYCQA